jgi:hypothetical protein
MPSSDTDPASSVHPVAAPVPQKPKKKKRKKNSSSKKQKDQPVLGPCFISTIPLELLAEILLFTESPKDVLAFTRTSKFFCQLLVNPSQAFIWKGVRALYPVPPPDPMSIFSEASYASFLFDGGDCSVRF